jgi:hypothetical protein
MFQHLARARPALRCFCTENLPSRRRPVRAALLDGSVSFPVLMRTKFKPLRERPPSFWFGEKVVGDGKTAAMSSALRRLAPVLDSYDGLRVLPRIVFTPQFFSDFLRRSGAERGNYIQYESAIERTEFLPAERDAIKGALESFRGLNLMVCLDECTARRSGFWHTSVIHAAETLDHVLCAVKMELKADFSDDVTAFKKRIGLPVDEMQGVMVMPLDLMQIAGPMLTTPLHAIATTRFSDNEPLVRMGTGIVGAERREAAEALVKETGTKQMLHLALNVETAHMIDANSRDGLPHWKHVAEARAALMEILMHPERAMDSLGRLLDRLKREKPLTLELSYNGRGWTIIHAAEADLGKVERPRHGGSVCSMWAADRDTSQYGVGVLGRKVVESDIVFPVRCLSPDGSRALAEFNASASGYVLLFDGPLERFSTQLAFEDYSNAGAVVCRDDVEGEAGMASLRPALRMAGIPVLASHVDDDFLQGLRYRKPNKRRLRIYVNDAVPEGFACEA